MLEYFFNMLIMFGHVIQVDEYIIQIDHNTDIQKVGKMLFMNCWKAVGALVRPKGIIDHLNDP